MDITIYDLIDATRKLESVKEAYYRAYTEILNAYRERDEVCTFEAINNAQKQRFAECCEIIADTLKTLILKLTNE